MFAIQVRKDARKEVCKPGWIWVKNREHLFYVEKRRRGIFATREEAQSVIVEDWEIIVDLAEEGL